MLRMGMHLQQRLDLRLVQAHIINLRLTLLQELRQVTYTPEGKCSRCARQLTLLEILEGFSDDPTDFLTVCTACGTRFNPKLKYKDDLGGIELNFICPAQVLAGLRDLENANLCSPAMIRVNNASLYHSALIHFGTLRNAFKKVGIKYNFKEVASWKPRIRRFLGHLPDGVLAKFAGVSRSTIWCLRKKLGIPPFDKNDAD